MKKITIVDVAKKADVSLASASRALSGKGPVSEKIKEKVLQAAKELGYIADSTAQNMRRSSTHSIAVMIPDINRESIPLLVQGVEEVARKAGYSVLLYIANDDAALEKQCVEEMLSRRVDGCILSSAACGSSAIYELRRNHIPVVQALRFISNLSDAVVADNFGGAYDAVSHLIKIGRRKIAICTGNTELAQNARRLEGYKKALLDGGIEFDDKRLIREAGNEESVLMAVNAYLKTDTPDAVFAVGDDKAIVCIKALTEHGYRVPQDVSVIGFDNIPIDRMIVPSLSSVVHDTRKIGSLAAERLLQRIDNGIESDPIREVVKSELIVRDSV